MQNNRAPVCAPVFFRIIVVHKGFELRMIKSQFQSRAKVLWGSQRWKVSDRRSTGSTAVLSLKTVRIWDYFENTIADDISRQASWFKERCYFAVSIKMEMSIVLCDNLYKVCTGISEWWENHEYIIRSWNWKLSCLRRDYKCGRMQRTWLCSFGWILHTSMITNRITYPILKLLPKHSTKQPLCNVCWQYAFHMASAKAWYCVWGGCAHCCNQMSIHIQGSWVACLTWLLLVLIRESIKEKIRQRSMDWCRKERIVLGLLKGLACVLPWYLYLHS